MNPVYDHIQHTKYLLLQLLESGFLSGRGFDEELRHCAQTANELGLATGSSLITKLSHTLAELRAGQGSFDQAALIYSAITAYLDFVTNKLIIESIGENHGTAITTNQ